MELRNVSTVPFEITECIFILGKAACLSDNRYEISLVGDFRFFLKDLLSLCFSIWDDYYHWASHCVCYDRNVWRSC